MNRKTTKREKPKTGLQAEPAPEPEVIVSAPLRGEMLPLATISILMGLFMLIGPWLTLPSNKTDSTVTALLCGGVGIFFLCGAAGIIVSLREYVRADNDGLHWRGWRGPERFVAWTDVDDYYCATAYNEVRTQQSRSGTGGKVIRRDGTQFTFVRGWSNTALLAKRVKERAVNAKAHDWTIKGARPHDDWPRTYHYQIRENRIVPWIAVPLLIGGAAYLSFCVYWSTAAYIAFMGWGYCITFTLLFGGTLWLIALSLTVLIVPDKQTRVRMHQQITLTRDGIKFNDGNGSVFVGWEQITAARLTEVRTLRPSLCILETDVGTIEFTPRLQHAIVLGRAILYNAPRVHEWRLPEDNNALPTRHIASSSSFVHHYRTYSNRLWILLGWSFPSCLWLGVIAERSMNVEPRMLSFALVFTMICALPLLWFGLLYKTVRIERDEEGLTFHTFFGVRYLLWSQVTDFRQRDFGGPHVFTIESRAGRFVFYSCISESDRLMRAIEAHLPASATISAEQTIKPEAIPAQIHSPHDASKPLVLDLNDK